MAGESSFHTPSFSGEGASTISLPHKEKEIAVAESNERVIPGVTGALVVRMDGLLWVLSIVTTVMLWYCLALAALALYLLIGRPPVEQALQYGSAAGLAPIPLAAASWRAVAWALQKATNGYVRKHYLP